MKKQTGCTVGLLRKIKAYRLTISGLLNYIIDCLSQGLRDGTPLQVHQWDISRYPPELRDCNCPAIFGTSEHSPQLSTMGSQIANQISQQVIQLAPVQTVANPVVGIWDPQNTPLVIIAGSEDGKAGSPASVRLTYPDCMQQDSIPICMTTPQLGQGCAAPLLYTAQNGVPINTSHGAILAEMRGIFISGLIYSVTEKDIIKLLSQAGRVRACELRKDSKTGQFRGSATVLYERKEDARTAINMFNSCIYMGRTLTVRWDRDSTPLDTSRTLTAPTQPVIVNGSTPYNCD